MDISSGEEDDRLERMMMRHQQRNVSNWGQGDHQHIEKVTRNDRRDERRDNKRQKRRDEKKFDPDQSFEVDTTGTDVPRRAVAEGENLEAASTKRADGLLLPGHVEIQSGESEGDEGQEDLEEAVDANIEGELGNFITMDADKSGVARYYEVDEQEQRMAFEECPSCGEKGHDKKSCPHQLCLACGALDEHQTRECPKSLSCYRCGGQGHRAAACKMPRTSGPQGWKDCRRCGATSHVEANCPSHWRIYTYHTPDIHKAERCRLFKELGATSGTSKGKRTFDYRSESESESEEEGETSTDPPKEWDAVVRWCYNCAAQGNHWGDNCPLPRCNPTYIKGDPSAYSEFMASMGPYSHCFAPPPPPDPLAYRDGLRGREEPFDRFTAGPHSSMHVYDPQREAMASVDQLFDRYGPGASRRRDAERRRGDREYDAARPRPAVDRRSGHGSKADRYKDMNQERRGAHYRDDDRPDQVSSNGRPVTLNASDDRLTTVEISKTERKGKVMEAPEDLKREEISGDAAKPNSVAGPGPNKKGYQREEGLLGEERAETRALERARKASAKEEKRSRNFEKSEDDMRARRLLDHEKEEARIIAAKAKTKVKREEKKIIADREREGRMRKKKVAAERAQASARLKEASLAKKNQERLEMLSAIEAKKQEKEQKRLKGAKEAEEGRRKKMQRLARAKEVHEGAQARLLAQGKLTKHASKEAKWKALEASWSQKGLI
ncbi:hypothetical protein CBS101457_000359 [Exobasidium rhododendri]|nr:hypothetical protein CBS101457_000359 [Exobasidium rhododendri]